MTLRAHLLRLALLCALLWPAAGASALVIETTFVQPGRSAQGFLGIPAMGPAPATVGGGTLEAVVRAAADLWEDIFADDHLLRIQFGWANFSGNTLAAANATPSDPLASPRNGLIRFDNSSRLWFLDATPSDHAEFAALPEIARDLGAGPVNAKRAFDDVSGATGGGADLFTIALHEIGHTLGIENLDAFGHGDGFIDVTAPRPLAGSRIPVVGFGTGFEDFSHLGIGTTLMDQSGGRNFGDRVLPSDADVLAVAEVNGWTEFSLRAAAVPEPASGALAGAGLLLLALLRRRGTRQ